MQRHGHKYRNVARIVGRTGTKGEVRVETIDGLPFLLREGMEVFLSPPRLTGIRSSVVKGVRPLGDAWSVSFADCRTVEDAFSLEGRLCLVNMDDIDELSLEDDPSMLLGMQVSDHRLGALGVITDLLINTEQIVIVVGDEERLDRYLIPLVDEYVEDVGEDMIFVAIPESLADLNA